MLIKAIVNGLAANGPPIRAVLVLLKTSTLLRRDVYARNRRNGMSQPFTLVRVQDGACCQRTVQGLDLTW